MADPRVGARTKTTRLAFSPEIVRAIAGDLDNNLRTVEKTFGVHVAARDAEILIRGEPAAVNACARLVEELASLGEQHFPLDGEGVAAACRLAREAPRRPVAERLQSGGIGGGGRRHVLPRTARQQDYVEAIGRSDVVFAIGPAGTGKTYLAVAMAVQALVNGRVRRLVLCRPAVEAGERLGFLPGDLAQKVDPYLRPLYDALYDLWDADKVRGLIEAGVVEIAPLAFMRGRTLNEAFIIVDEAQNTTPEQMKMLLTRIGEGSHAIITGDITQIDLPAGRQSGLIHARDVVRDTEGIEFVHFDKGDVVRHELVQRIVDAYEQHEERAGAARDSDSESAGRSPDG